jgi:DNA-directed RNA polymerase subunit F
MFLNSISQNITIFIDEYEKIFGNSSEMLTIMDGALNSDFRRVFLLTTNELNVEQNLIQRPGRIRYLKKFQDLKPSIVEEIVDDLLIYKQFKKECINFISNLETITVDIVKAIIEEVNIHEESPLNFETIFNVKKIKGKHNLFIKEKDGNLTELASNANIYPRPMYNETHVGYYLEINGHTIGNIIRVINFSTIEVEPLKGSNNENIGFNEPIIIKIEDADIINYTFAYDGYGSSVVTPTKKNVSLFAQNIINKIKEDNHNKHLSLNDYKTEPPADFNCDILLDA